MFKIKNPSKREKSDKNAPPAVSPYSKLVTFLLCIFAGFIGAHRLYTRRYVTAFLMAATFGYCFIGVIVDIYNIRKNRFYDWRHRPVVSIRTKGDTLALLVSIASPYVSIKLLPIIFYLIVDLVLWGGEYTGLIDNPDLIHQKIEQLRAGGGIKTSIHAPEILYSPIDGEKSEESKEREGKSSD